MGRFASRLTRLLFLAGALVSSSLVLGQGSSAPPAGGGLLEKIRNETIKVDPLPGPNATGTPAPQAKPTATRPAQADAPPSDQPAPIPSLRARVTDAAGVMDAGTVAQITQKLAAFEAKTGGQIAVLVVPTALPETIEQYALRVGETWKVGRKGKDNGALMVVAMREKKIRIETGYGYEGALPDVEAKRIIREVMAPYFKQGQVSAGISAGVDKILLAVGKDAATSAAVGTPDTQEWNKSHQAGTGDEVSEGLLGMAPMLLGLLFIGSFFLNPFILGLLAGGGTFFMSSSLPLAGAVGVGTMVVAGIVRKLFGGLRNGFGQNHRVYRSNSNGWSTGGMYGGGSMGGSWGGNWNGGDSGWSGGGGTFGGGGASGGWDSGGDSGGGE